MIDSMRRILRWLRRIAITLLILVAVVLTFYFIVLPSIVRRKAISAMEEAGIVGGDLRVSGLTPSRLDVTDLSLGPDTGAGIRAAALSAEFDWRELISAGRVRGLDIVGAEWRIVVRGDKIDLGLPSLPPKPPSTAKPPEAESPWPDRIRVRAASVVVDWDGREFRIPGEVSLTHQANDQWFVEARVDLPGAPVKIASTLGTPASGKSATTMPDFPASAPDEPVRLLEARVRIAESKLDWHITGGVTSDRMMRFTATPAPEPGEPADSEPAVRLRYEHGPIGTSDKNAPTTRPSDRVTLESHWDHDGPLPGRIVESLSFMGIDASELGVVKSRGKMSASAARTSDASGKATWSWEIDASRFKLRVAGGNLALRNRAVILNGLSIDADGAASVGSLGRTVDALRGEMAVKRATVRASVPDFAKSWLASKGVDIRNDATLESNGELIASALLDTSAPERSWRWALATKGVTAKLSPSDIDVKPLGLSLMRFAGAGEFDGVFGTDGNTIHRFAADVHAERVSHEGELPEMLASALASAGFDASRLGKVALSGTLDAAVSRGVSPGEPAWKWDVSASKLDARVFGGDLAWGGGSAVRGLELDLHADARLTERSLTIINTAASSVRFTSASGGVGEDAWSLVVPEAARANTPKVVVGIAELRASGDAFGTDMQKPATADVTIDTPVRFTGKGMTAELARVAMKPELLVKNGAIVSLRATPRIAGGEFLMPAAQLELHDIAGDIPIRWSPAAPASKVATTAASRPAATRPTTQPADYADARTGGVTIGSAKVYGIEIPALAGRLGFDNTTLLAAAGTKQPMLGAAMPEARMWLDFSGGKPSGELWVNVPAFELTDPDALGKTLPLAKGANVTGVIAAELHQPFGAVQRDRIAYVEARGVNWSRPKEKLFIEGVTGSLALQSFKPMVSEAKQLVKVQKLTVNNVELRDGEITAELHGPDAVYVKTMRWNLTEGGTLSTKDVRISSSTESVDVPLEFRTANIRQLMGVLLGENVEGEGPIDGVLPLRVSFAGDEMNVSLLPGKLVASNNKPGWVRMPAAREKLREALSGIPAEIGDRMADALTDFEYKSFTFELMEKNGAIVGQIQTSGRGRSGKKQEIGGLTVNINGIEDGFLQAWKEYRTNPLVKQLVTVLGGIKSVEFKAQQR